MGIDKSTWYKSGTFFSSDDREIFYKREGVGPTLLCLHGFPTSSWDYAPIWSSLIKKFDVIATDLLGLGYSSKMTKPLTVMVQADIVEELIKSLGIKEAHILAHDLGDTVAQELMARDLEGKIRIKWLSCVLLNGGIFPEGHSPRLIQKLLISRIGPLIAQFSTYRTFEKNMITIFSKEHPPSQEFLKDSWSLLVQNGGRRSLPRLIQYMKERRKFKERWLSSIQSNSIPIRLINGLQDPVSGLEMVTRYKELIPNPDIIELPEAGHYPHVETPEMVLSAFFEFHDNNVLLK